MATTTGALDIIITPAPLSLARWTDCRLCGSKLFQDRGDDKAHGVCKECLGRPEARRFLSGTTTPAAKKPRGFGPAEKALIGKLQAFMPAAQLLDILNARLLADLGAAAVPFTTAQLQDEVSAQVTTSATGGEWASLRKLLAQARRSGLLTAMTPALIDDFAVVWKLSPAQHMHLRDVIRNAQEVA